ncbi:MAG: hypothetical protein ACP5GE_04665, partial [Thermoplasmata archaeon]
IGNYFGISHKNFSSSSLYISMSLEVYFSMYISSPLSRASIVKCLLGLRARPTSVSIKGY